MKKFILWGIALLYFQPTLGYTACTQNDLSTLMRETHTSSSLFGVNICSGNKARSYGGSSIEGVIDQVSEKELKQTFGDQIAAGGFVFFQIDLRGLPVYIYYTAGSSDIVFQVPSLGIKKTFQGSNRDASKDLLEKYLKTEGDKILKALTRVSPVDPVAGNPTSLQTRMLEADFNAGTETDYSGDTEMGAPNRIGLAARFGRYVQGGREIDIYTLPLSYTFKLRGNHELMLRLPITYSKVEEAESYQVVFGMSYKRMINERWALTPSLSYGAMGSIDLGTVAQIASGSLTSEYLLIDRPKYSIRMGNMGGYYKTLPFKYNDIDLDLGLKTSIMRNGLSIAFQLPMRLGGRQMGIEMFVTDTQIYGDELYIDQYNEIGLSLSPMRRARDKANFASSDFGLAVKYSHYDEGHGFNFSLSYKF